MSWWKSLKSRVRLGESLRNYTTFRIGGPARYLVEPKNISDLKLSIDLARRHKIPFFVIGAGINILINDKGVNALVLRLNSCYFKKITIKDNYLEAGAGCLLSKLVSLSREQGFSGVEFLAGIPGTVGGALIMNAGTRDKNFADLVEKVTVIDYNNTIKILDKKRIKFGYRSSDLSKYIILSARIKVSKRNSRLVAGRIKKYLNYRHATQDHLRPSLGCIFKNPNGDSAGRLIELCGLKGKRCGDACVSERHANFIVNLGNAKASDVFKLMKLIKRRVRTKFNLRLQSEIKVWQ